MSVQIKVCGLTCIEDVLDALELGVHYLGFVFDPDSPYFIAPDECQSILEEVPFNVPKVGVFANAPEQFVIDTATDLDLAILQFDGDESFDYCTQFARPHIKRFSPKREADLELMNGFASDYYLIDSGIQSTDLGSSFTGYCDLAREAKSRGPIFLSQGLNEKNIEMALRTVKPFAVNVCEGIELSVGKKDYSKMQEFVRRVLACEF